MTGSRIKAIVKDCCGVDCEVTFGSSRLVIEIPSDAVNADMLREVINHYTIPAHIAIDIYFTEREMEQIRTGIIWQADEIFNLKEAEL